MATKALPLAKLMVLLSLAPASAQMSQVPSEIAMAEEVAKEILLTVKAQLRVESLADVRFTVDPSYIVGTPQHHSHHEAVPQPVLDRFRHILGADIRPSNEVLVHDGINRGPPGWSLLGTDVLLQIHKPEIDGNTATTFVTFRFGNGRPRQPVWTMIHKFTLIQSGNRWRVMSNEGVMIT